MLRNTQPSQRIYLKRIIQNAHQKYLKQSRIRNHHSTFNLLKILSSYKQFTSRNISIQLKNKLYNRIIMITKYFNPQTYQQWLNSIQSINQFITTTQISQIIADKSKSDPNITLPYHISKRTQTVNNQNLFNHKQQEDVSQIFDQIKDQSISSFDSKTQSKFLIQRKNRGSHNSMNLQNTQNHLHKNVNNYSDLQCKGRYKKINGNLHYVSFEPSQNIFEQNKQNLALEDNQPTRTPFSRSFIHNLPTSNGSPFVLSKITNNTKDATMIEQSQQDIEQWKNMVARADIFYNINLKFKAVSALIANCEAFGEYRQLRQRAKIFHNYNTYMKVFAVLHHHSQIKKAQKNTQKIMKMHYQQKTLQKCFRILSINYQLRINSERESHKTEIASKYNQVVCDFLCHLFLKCSQRNLEESFCEDYESTPKSIRIKAKYFEQTLNIEKMQMIMGNFSLSSLSRQTIQKLFELKRKSILKSYLQDLHNNAIQNRNNQTKIKQLIIKNRLRKLIRKTKQKITQNSQNLYITVLYNNKVKSKIFKCLQQCYLSKKLYIKRQNYLQSNKNANIKISIFRLWRQRCNWVLKNKLDLSTKLQRLSCVIKPIFYRHIFKIFKQINNDTIQQQIQAQKLRDTTLMKVIFDQLKNRSTQRRLYHKIKNAKKINKLIKLYKIWNQKTKAKLLHKHTLFFTKSLIFNRINKESIYKICEEKVNKNYKQHKYLQTLNKLKRFHLAYKKTQQLKMKKIQRTIIIKNSIKSLLQIMQNDQRVNIYQKQSLQLVSNTNKLQKLQKIRNLNQLLYKTQKFKQKQIKYADQVSKLERIVIKQTPTIIKYDQNNDENMHYCTIIRKPIQSKIQFYTQLKQYKIQQQKIYHLQQNIIKHNHYTKFLQNFKRNSNINHHIENSTKIIHKSLKKQTIKYLYQYFNQKASQQRQRQYNAHQIYYKKLLWNTWEAFMIRVLKKKQKIDKLKQVIRKFRTNIYAERFIQQLKAINIIKNKFKLIQKKTTYNKLMNNIIEENIQSEVNTKQKKLKFTLNAKHLLKSLKQKSIKISENQEIGEKYEKCTKTIFLNRFQQNIIKDRVMNKTNYMALKYYAIKIQRKTFKSLCLNFGKKQQKIKSILIQDQQDRQYTKRFRIYEHISTEYSSI